MRVNALSKAYDKVKSRYGESVITTNLTARPYTTIIKAPMNGVETSVKTPKDEKV